MFYEGTLQNGVTEGERVMDQVSYTMPLACFSCHVLTILSTRPVSPGRN